MYSYRTLKAKNSTYQNTSLLDFNLRYILASHKPDGLNFKPAKRSTLTTLDSIAGKCEWNELPTDFKDLS